MSYFGNLAIVKNVFIYFCCGVVHYCHCNSFLRYSMILIQIYSLCIGIYTLSASHPDLKVEVRGSIEVVFFFLVFTSSKSFLTY